MADQLGHANPELTLRTYAHALPVDDEDLAFADFGRRKPAPSGSFRLYPAPGSDTDIGNENPPGLTGRGRSENLERETGIEPATLTLAT